MGMANGGKQVVNDGKKVFTDKEIIKALEHHKKRRCFECPLRDNEKSCSVTISTLALDLINRQQAEIEDYKRNIKQLTETLTDGNGLRIRVDNMIVYADDLEEWLEFCDKQKEEAIKEYMKILEEKLSQNTDISNVGYQSIIFDMEQGYKEMVGEQE
jgi:N12 class adenine-specific DNA methylase